MTSTYRDVTFFKSVDVTDICFKWTVYFAFDSDILNSMQGAEIGGKTLILLSRSANKQTAPVSTGNSLMGPRHSYKTVAG
jgi:hypothetical protein